MRDVRDGFGSLSRRGFEVKLLGHRRGKSHGAVHELHDPAPVIQSSCWANLPPELLRDVIERLEASEATWPNRKNVVSCAAVCRTWRVMCKEIVKNPEFSGKITFPVSLKQVMNALFGPSMFHLFCDNFTVIFICICIITVTSKCKVVLY